MATKLISCNACGTKNLANRPACLQCGSSLIVPVPHSEVPDRVIELVEEVSAPRWAIPKFNIHWNAIRVMQFSLISAVVIVAFSVFYYFVIFTPKREEARRKTEQARIELQQREVEAKTNLEAARVALEIVKEKQKQEEHESNKVLLEDCLNNSYKAYLLNWAIASRTETQRKATEIQRGGVTALVNCAIMRLDANVCRSIAEYAVNQSKAVSANYHPLAPLPSIVANSLNADLYQQKDECFKRYPQ